MSNCVEKPKTSRHRKYCFTINNYDDDDVKKVMTWVKPSKYLIFGYEIAPTTGTKHIQGYVHFINAKCFSSMKKLIPKIHLEPAKGNDTQNRNYCIKGGNYEEFGECSKQGKRSDIDTIRDAIKSGKNVRDCYEIATSYQASKFAENYYRVYHDTKRTKPPLVLWLYGSTGCGKTRYAFDNYPELHNVAYHNNFFQGITPDHKVVLIDDFRKDFCKFNYLLKILDRYPMVVNIKGHEMNWKPETIIITCPYHPEEVYNTREDVGQLTRRITHIINCDEIKNINSYISI